MNRYYVMYSTEPHEPMCEPQTFATETDVIKFLNKNAGNLSFRFVVIYGELQEYVPAELVKVFTTKRGYVRD